MVEKIEQSQSFYSGALTTVFEHVAEVLSELKDPTLLNFGLSSFLFLIENTQKECDEFCEEMLKKFIENNIHKQLKLVMKPNSNFDAAEVKHTIDEIISLSLKCEIYCNFLVTQINESFMLAEYNQIEELAVTPSNRMSFLSRKDDSFVSDEAILKKEKFKGYSKEEVENLVSLKKKSIQQINISKLKRSIQEAMNSYFVLEKYYMECTITTAMQSIQNDEEIHFIDVDSYFFILSSCSRRAIISMNVNIACAIINLVITSLQHELLAVCYFFHHFF